MHCWHSPKEPAIVSEKKPSVILIVSLNKRTQCLLEEENKLRRENPFASRREGSDELKNMALLKSGWGGISFARGNPNMFFLPMYHWRKHWLGFIGRRFSCTLGSIGLSSICFFQGCKTWQIIRRVIVSIEEYMERSAVLVCIVCLPQSSCVCACTCI